MVLQLGPSCHETCECSPRCKSQCLCPEAALTLTGKVAADLLQQEQLPKEEAAHHGSKVAVTLAQIEKTGDVLRDAKSTYFFGAEPSQLGGLLANPNVMGR